MREQINSRKKRQAARRASQRDYARDLMHQIVDCTGDIFIHYTNLYAIWCGYASWHEDLRPFFEIPGVYLGWLSVNNAFKEKVRTLAAEWLKKDSEQDKQT